MVRESVKYHYLYSVNGRQRHRSAQCYITNLLLNQVIKFWLNYWLLNSIRLLNTDLLRGSPAPDLQVFFFREHFLSLLLPCLMPCDKLLHLLCQISEQIWESECCLCKRTVDFCTQLPNSCKSKLKKWKISNIWYISTQVFNWMRKTFSSIS